MKRIEEVTLLYEISKALNEHMDLRKSLYSVLDILSSSMDMVRGTITILDLLRNEINIEVAHGMSRIAARSIKYKVGEGITGRVIEKGRPIAIPRISEEPEFLNRTATRRSKQDQERSFICVPIKTGKQVIGALSVDKSFDKGYRLREGQKLLSVVAAMIAQHVVRLETIKREKERLREENRRLKKELENKYTITNIIGNSNKMREVYQMISQVSRSNATVLIRGESGTGKELVANSIHYNSLRTRGPFIKINCAAIPANLIESELFGHEKGAFTGAIKQKLGRFELANRGTLFLDEERKTDILLLSDFFLERYSKENQKNIKRFSTPAIDMLMVYHWPGNVRELENCIERAVLLCEEGVIHSYHLPPTLQTGEESGTLPGQSLEESVEALEREMIIDALKNTRGNATTAADLLRTTVRKFNYKAKRYGVDYRRYR